MESYKADLEHARAESREKTNQLEAEKEKYSELNKELEETVEKLSMSQETLQNLDHDHRMFQGAVRSGWDRGNTVAAEDDTMLV